MSLLVEYWKSKAKLSYLSVNKTSPGNKKEKFVKLFYCQKLWTIGTELELEPVPPSCLAGAGSGSQWNGSTTLV